MYKSVSYAVSLTHKNYTDEVDNVDMSPHFHQHFHLLYEVIHDKFVFVITGQELDSNKLISAIISFQRVRH